MAFELKQELKLSQNLVMTPQLQLAIRLLQLSRLELVDLVREEMQANPVLEDTAEATGLDGPDSRQEPKDNPPEVDWETYLGEQNDYSSPRVNFSERMDENDDFIGNISSSNGGLREHLLTQLHMQGLGEEDSRLGEFIIGNVDEDGYLRMVERDGMGDGEYEKAVLEEISRLAGLPGERVESVLSVVHGLDPLGACARTLRECLLVQARALPVRDTVVEDILDSHLSNLAKRDYRAVARDLGITADEVIEAARTINRCLNPTPGSGFGSDEARAILPDIFIHKVGDEYVITLNEDGMPKLKVSRYYRELMSGGQAVSGQARAYLQDKLKSALWLIKSVHERQRTIYKVVECIVRYQRDFLDKGLKHLRPLILRNVAEDIGVHESTVSRVTTNKYVQTPRGIYELKYFFTSGLSGTDGTDLTVEYIKEKVKEVIEGEDSSRPYSDQQIVEILKGQGIKLARRTATKYRESLGYLSSSRRKAPF